LPAKLPLVCNVPARQVRGVDRLKRHGYVRNHLDEVNERLVAQGLRPIDPNDPRMRERYGLGEAA
jgi:hypothetical protein